MRILRKHYRSLTEGYRTWFPSFSSSLSPILSEIGLLKVFRNFSEALRKRRKLWKPFSNKTWRILISSPPPFAKCTPFYLHSHIAKYTPIFVFLLSVSSWKVTELYGLRNDTCFLSVMSRNFTDYATIPSLTSGMLRNFTDCATILPFDFRHVAELHGLPNDEC